MTETKPDTAEHRNADTSTPKRLPLSRRRPRGLRPGMHGTPRRRDQRPPGLHARYKNPTITRARWSMHDFMAWPADGLGTSGEWNDCSYYKEE